MLISLYELRKGESRSRTMSEGSAKRKKTPRPVSPFPKGGMIFSAS
jgi:hypothetical protein